MGFACGIVGLPNVGKSTLFNALTQAQIDAANYPFCTIEPNVGTVPVKDPRLTAIANIIKPQKIIPTVMQFVDIAGLVKDAAKGEGLGNQFLANIRDTDAIAHVVRCFSDPNVVHVDGTVNPSSDIETIHTELYLADLETLTRARERAQKQSKAAPKTAQSTISLYEQLEQHLSAGKPARTYALTAEEYELVAPLRLISMKPMMLIANVGEEDYHKDPMYQQVEAIAAAQAMVLVPISVQLESEIAGLPEEEQAEFLAEVGLEEPGLNRVIRAGHQLLGRQTYFTAGEKEVRAWDIPVGATAPQAAGKIHSDFEKGFIRAEVVAYDDFIHLKGEQGAREKGKLRVEGKEYIVKDGDIMHFLFNV